jgi:drug/metabolite transporter (DMT)-like permease
MALPATVADLATVTSKKPAGWLVDLSLVAIALIWGATFVLVKQALADISTLLFLTLRFTIAALVLALLFHRELRGPNLARRLRGGVIAGVFLFSGYVLQTAGLRYTTASKAGFITGLYIPLVPLFSAMIYRRIPQLTELLGVATAFSGLALMTIQRDIFDIGRGDLLVACCAIAYSFHILALGRFAKDTGAGLLALTQITTGAILGGATFWWAEPVRIRWTAGVAIALAVTGLLATALAFVIQSWAQRWSSPTRTALIFSMEPVFAWVTSYVVARESLSRRATLGAVLILAGILLVELKPRLARPHPS